MRGERARGERMTRNEILTTLNKPDAFILAIVDVSDCFAAEPRYVRRPFQCEPDFGATSVTNKIADLVAHAMPDVVDVY